MIAVITDVDKVKSKSLETMLSEIARELFLHPRDNDEEIINTLL